MELERAKELIAQQISFGSGYNRNSVRLILGEVQREQGMHAANLLIKAMDLERLFDLRPGTDFTRINR
jgi:hypothetical protein